MKVHKVTVCIIDFDELGPDEIKVVLENTRYPNRCISPHVLDTETREVDWHEQHPLNLTAKQDEAFRELFNTPVLTTEEVWSKPCKCNYCSTTDPNNFLDPEDNVCIKCGSAWEG